MYGFLEIYEIFTFVKIILFANFNKCIFFVKRRKFRKILRWYSQYLKNQ